MLVDIFTYNERIALYMYQVFQKETEVDDSEPDNFPIHSVRNLSITRKELEENLKRIDELVDVATLSSVVRGGGYIVRDSKTGDFLAVKKSRIENIALEARNN